MPFMTGTATTPSDLLKQMSNFMTANGWTKLRGEEDMACASPKAARYWRTINFGVGSGVGLRLWNLRTNIGGPSVTTDASKLSVSNIRDSGYNPATLISGSANFLSDNSWTPLIITYDFTTPTVIREIYLQAHSTQGVTYRSAQVMLQWSHDGVVWTTMQIFEDTGTWTNSGFKTLTVPDGTVYAQHFNASNPRRCGTREDSMRSGDQRTTTYRDYSNDVWSWLGPGYDASRRVYIHAMGHSQYLHNSNCLEIGYSTGYNSADWSISTQPGGARTVFHLMAFNNIRFWLYVNSHRVILVTQNEVSDYTSSYLGFLSAFSLPDEYPFPLCASSSSSTRDLLSQIDNSISSMADPGRDAICVKRMDSTDLGGGNRIPSVERGKNYTSLDAVYVWPYHFGSAAQNTNYPLNKGGGGWTVIADSVIHIFDRMTQTAQGEIPFFPCMVIDKKSGALGAMTGVFAVPGAGVLAPNQLMTFGGASYRIFPNRSRRNGSDWFAVKEE